MTDHPYKIPMRKIASGLYEFGFIGNSPLFVVKRKAKEWLVLKDNDVVHVARTFHDAITYVDSR
jgi:hypothetical protein